MGIDTNNADLFASAVTEDVVVDFSAVGRKTGLDFPPIEGRDVVVGGFLASMGPLDTTHSVSNLRIAVEGDAATLAAQVLGRHFPPGEGAKPDHERPFVSMNFFEGELVRSGDTWRFARLAVDNAWSEGDPGVLATGADAHP